MIVQALSDVFFSFAKKYSANETRPFLKRNHKTK